MAQKWRRKVRKEPMSNRQVLQEFQQRMLRGFRAIEKDHVVARGYEQYNEGWDDALTRVKVLQDGVVKDLMKLVTMDAKAVNSNAGKPEHDPINHPSYYTDGIETLDYILEKKMDFLTGQVCKYISRFGKKDPSKAVEDLKKAQFYLNRKIGEMEKSEKREAKALETKKKEERT